MVLKDPRFKTCERIYIIGFSLFLKIKYLDMFLEVYQLLTYLILSQSWYDLSSLRMFTVVNCIGHINFDLSKIYDIFN